MDLISLVVVLIIIGVLLFFVNKAPFIDGNIKQIITWLVIAVVVLWILSLFIGDLPRIRIGK